MKRAIAKRIAKLESRTQSILHHKCALVVYDPAGARALDDIQFNADIVLMLPDNGRRNLGDDDIKGSYRVYYP